MLRGALGGSEILIEYIERHYIHVYAMLYKILRVHSVPACSSAAKR